MVWHHYRFGIWRKFSMSLYPSR